MAKTHLDFLGSLKFADQVIKDLQIRDVSEETFHSAAARLEKLTDKIDELRMNNLVQRRALFEEARYIIQHDHALQTGVIRAISDDEEEIAVNNFLKEFVDYFCFDRPEAYSHDLEHLLTSLAGTTLMLQKHKEHTSRVSRLLVQLDRVRQQIAESELRLTSKWARIAYAFAEVRLRLIPTRDVHILANVQELLPKAGLHDT